jgi:uncharacterized Zn finger protein
MGLIENQVKKHSEAQAKLVIAYLIANPQKVFDLKGKHPNDLIWEARKWQIKRKAFGKDMSTKQAQVANIIADAIQNDKGLDKLGDLLIDIVKKEIQGKTDELANEAKKKLTNTIGKMPKMPFGGKSKKIRPKRHNKTIKIKPDMH